MELDDAEVDTFHGSSEYNDNTRAYGSAWYGKDSQVELKVCYFVCFINLNYFCRAYDSWSSQTQNNNSHRRDF